MSRNPAPSRSQPRLRAGSPPQQRSGSLQGWRRSQATDCKNISEDSGTRLLTQASVSGGSHGEQSEEHGQDRGSPPTSDVHPVPDRVPGRDVRLRPDLLEDGQRGLEHGFAISSRCRPPHGRPRSHRRLDRLSRRRTHPRSFRCVAPHDRECGRGAPLAVELVPPLRRRRRRSDPDGTPHFPHRGADPAVHGLARLGDGLQASGCRFRSGNMIAPRASTIPAKRQASVAADANAVAPAIGDYAIIGDCRTAALVSRDGSIDWLCLPHFSGRSVFAAILDPERGGRFCIRPKRPFQATRRYLGSTPVLETTFETESGTARLTDLMPVAEDASAIQPTREILRVIEGVAGEVELEVRFEPRPDYARVPPRFGSRGTLGWACTWSDELFLLRGDMPLELASDATAVVGCIKTSAAGKKRYLSLCYAKADIGVIAPLGEAADERMRATVRWWTGWSSRCVYEGPYRDAVLRSAVTLKLMTFALSGAVVAAPTTSLPEAIGGERNWDYRYC